jgi:PPOX class probable F420-dependent enzyme
MPRPPLPPHLLDLLRAPHPAVVATVRPDGQPVSVATWYLLDHDDRILLNMDAGRRRLEYIRQDPRVSLSVLDGDGWSTHVSVQGRLVDLVDDNDLVDIDRIAVHYTGRPYANRTRGRVSGWIDIEFWHAWGPRATPKP